MLRLREASGAGQKSSQENQGPPPHVMDVRKCQIQYYVGVADADKPSIAQLSARGGSGPYTRRNVNTGSCKKKQDREQCRKRKKNPKDQNLRIKESQHKQ